MSNQVHDKPAEVSAEAGEVLVEGPGGITYSFTPEAADETSQRLLHGAVEAHGQRLLRKDNPSDLPDET